MTLYDLLVRAGYPLRWWVRLEVDGRDLLPRRGPVIVVANHDSMVDPLAVAAACHPVRDIRFLAMAELWNHRVLRFVLDRIRQIPTERGGGGALAIRHAVGALEQGEAVGIFPEGGLSHGRSVRARRGVDRLAAACPAVPIVLAAVTGTGDLVRFPKRPRARVTFLRPDPESSSAEPIEPAQRLLSQIRAVAPPAVAGRRGRLATRLRERRTRDTRRPARDASPP